MARNMWVQEQELGDVLDRRELESLVRSSYELVVATLPKSKRPGATPKAPAKKAATRKAAVRGPGARKAAGPKKAKRARRAR